MDINWQAIENDYIPGEFGFRKLSNKYNVGLRTIEAHFRRLKRTKKIPDEPLEGNIGECIIKTLLSVRGHPVDTDSLLKRYKITARVLDAYFQDLRDKGYDLIIDETSVLLNTEIKQAAVLVNDWSGAKTLKFAVVSDTHLNSNAQQLSHLKSFYELAAAKGVDTVYHCGDVVDGDCVYPGHQFEVFNIGIDKQKDYAVLNYPKVDGVKTVIIGGNHDLKWYHKGGADICKAIANEREDITYLGQYAADIMLTPKCKLRLEHPMGKPAYAVSYKTQRKIDNMRGGLKPNILCEGHYHYSAYFFRRNVHALCVPSFQGPTAFSTRLGLESDNGGFIITIKVDDNGSIVEFIPEFYPYYIIIDKDF